MVCRLDDVSKKILLEHGTEAPFTGLTADGCVLPLLCL